MAGIDPSRSHFAVEKSTTRWETYDRSPLPIPNTSVSRPAPMAWEGVSPTASMKKGLKKSAPETPEESATVENSIDAGDTHQWARNRSIGNADSAESWPDTAAIAIAPRSPRTTNRFAETGTSMGQSNSASTVSSSGVQPTNSPPSNGNSTAAT